MGSTIRDYIKTFVKSSRANEGSIWAGDRAFLSLFKEIEDRTLVSIDRCFNLFQLARYAAQREGEIAEVGVYRGGTGRLLARTCPEKTVHLFDTFTGMPETDGEIDIHKKDDFSDSSLKSVRAFLEDCPNISFHPGIFPNSAESLRDQSFCFIHIDVDIYQSARESLEFFYPGMVPGGVMVFDDYKWEGCPGIKQALDEFLADKPESPIITTLYQCMLIKI
jgi:O-methyltransferase